MSRNAATEIAGGITLHRITSRNPMPAQIRPAAISGTRDCADHVGGVLDTVGATEVRRADLLGQAEVAQRRTEPATEPREAPQGHHRRHGLNQRDGTGADRRERIAVGSPWPLALYTVPDGTPATLERLNARSAAPP
jgi:hypothetical protein